MRLLLILLLLSFTGCKKDIPIWVGKLWVGVSEHEAIERAQDANDNQIKCNDERFTGYICMSPEDFQSFVNTYIYGCKDWGTVKMEKDYKIYSNAINK